jgi:hypothetical protein
MDVAGRSGFVLRQRALQSEHCKGARAPILPCVLMCSVAQRRVSAAGSKRLLQGVLGIPALQKLCSARLIRLSTEPFQSDVGRQRPAEPAHVRDLQAAAPAGAAANSVAGPKAVFAYRAAQATVLAPLVCLSPGALDEAIVSAYVNDLFTWCASAPCKPGEAPMPACSSNVLRVRCPLLSAYGYCGSSQACQAHCAFTFSASALHAVRSQELEHALLRPAVTEA